jgi:uncharacterized membrane protein
MNRDEIVVSNALRAGVILAALCSFVGAAVYFSAPGAAHDYRVFEPARLQPGLSGLGFMAIGVLILLATPIFRVALLIIVFAREHDRLYAVISGIVLAVLVLGLSA